MDMVFKLFADNFPLLNGIFMYSLQILAVVLFFLVIATIKEKRK